MGASHMIIQNTLIELFQELGYAYECGYDVERDYRNPYYEEDLRDALRRQNPMLSDEVLNEAFRLVTHVNEGTLERRNETLMDYVQNGVEVKYSEGFALFMRESLPHASFIGFTGTPISQRDRDTKATPCTW